MPRFLSTVLVIALLGGTAVAFAVTQGLKLEPSPIRSTHVTKIFSPVCGCRTHVAMIKFRLRKPDRVGIQILAADGDVVRTLVSGRRLRRGTVVYTWDGRDDAGRVVAQGAYEPRVRLPDQHRTILLPNDMVVDTTPPKVRVRSVAPLVFSPDGNGHADTVTIRYRLSEPARAILLVDGRRALVTYRHPQTGAVVWNGRLKTRRLPVGVYRLQLAAQDPAGNVSAPSRPVFVRLRYVTLTRTVIRAKARTRFGVRVSADARVRWRLGTRTGTARPGLLVLRAPRKPGRLPLVVSLGDHHARATVIVRRR